HSRREGHGARLPPDDGRTANRPHQLRPIRDSQAALRAWLIGGLVGASAAFVPFAAGRVLRGRLEGRRIDQWDTEWERFGPMWSGRRAEGGSW
ncbi:hypothetical protein AB0P31_36085, partial [Streptomyces sp. NPDC088357]